MEPEFLLGNIGERHLLDLVASPQQQAFGNAKRDSLPAYCRGCDGLGRAWRQAQGIGKACVLVTSERSATVGEPHVLGSSPHPLWMT